MMTRLLSPYQLNPANYNPLQQVLEQSVDFDAAARSCPVKLFLSATNVRTGKVKMFTNDEITLDAVMASACLPFLFQAVEIDGEAYWDGGYMGNPAIFPLIYGCDSADVVVVHINPLERQEMPRSATRDHEPHQRDQLQLLADARDAGDRLRHQADRRGQCHRPVAQAHVHSRHLGRRGDAEARRSTSKLNADWEFLTHLRDDGRDFAGQWLDENFSRLGVAVDHRRPRPLPLTVLYFHLDAELHDLIGRHLEVGGGRLIERAEQHEQPFLDRVQVRALRRHQRFARQEIGRELEIDGQSVRSAQGEARGTSGSSTKP